MSSVQTITKKVISFSVGMLLLAVIGLIYFNQAYNYSITGFSTTTYTGIMTVILVLFLLGEAMTYLKK